MYFVSMDNLETVRKLFFSKELVTKKNILSNFQSNEFICNFTMTVRLKSGFSLGKKQQILFLLVKLLSLVD